MRWFRTDTNTLFIAEPIFWVSLTTYLVVLPIAHTIAIRNIAFLGLIASTLLAWRLDKFYLRQTIGRPPLVVPWTLLVLVGTVSSFNAINTEDSFSELRVEILYGFSLYLIGFFWGFRYSENLSRSLCILFAVNLLLSGSAAAFGSWGMDFNSIKNLPAFAFAGTDGNWILPASFLYLGLFATYSQKRSLVIGSIALIIILNCYSLLLSHNRQNFIALGFGILVSAISFLRVTKFSWQRLAFLFAALTCVAALLLVQTGRRPSGVADQSLQPVAAKTTIINPLTSAVERDVRWDLWKFSVSKIIENPVIGGGLGRSVFEKLYPDYRPDIPDLWHAHNMILNKGIQMGIPGIFAFLMLWLALTHRLWKARGSETQPSVIAISALGAITAVFAKNQTDDFFVRNVGYFFWLMVGLVMGRLSLDRVQGKLVLESFSTDSLLQPK